jgi:hypothetical protein
MPLIPKKWREEFNHLRPPVNNALQGDSSWINARYGRPFLYGTVAMLTTM